MSLIQVNYGAMDDGVRQITDTLRRLHGMFDDLQTQVNQLLPTWDGTAKEAYHAVQQSWNTVNTELNDALRQMGSGIDTANTNFQSAEQANTRDWGG